MSRRPGRTRGPTPCRSSSSSATRRGCLALRTFGTCTAIDSLVYVPEKQAAFDELARVVRNDGMLAISDLLGANRVTDAEGGVVNEFAESWDMAPLTTIDRHRRAIENAGFEIEAVRDITHNSVGRFRKWTTLFLVLVDRFDKALRRLSGRSDLDFRAVVEQVRRLTKCSRTSTT